MSQDDQQRYEEDLKQHRKDLGEYKGFATTRLCDLSTRYDRYALAVGGVGFVLFWLSLTYDSGQYHVFAVHGVGDLDYTTKIGLILLSFLVSIALTLARKVLETTAHIQTIKRVKQGKPVDMHQARSWTTIVANICFYFSAIATLMGLVTALILLSALVN